jgi:hypothetical protein
LFIKNRWLFLASVISKTAGGFQSLFFQFPLAALIKYRWRLCAGSLPAKVGFTIPLFNRNRQRFPYSSF